MQAHVHCVPEIIFAYENVALVLFSKAEIMKFLLKSNKNRAILEYVLKPYNGISYIHLKPMKNLINISLNQK